MQTNDYPYLAQLCHSLGRFDDSIEMIKKLAEVKPVFEKEERQLFGLVFKSAIDPIRFSIRTLLEYRNNQRKEVFVEIIQESLDDSRSKLNNLCETCFSIVDKYLLPSNNSPENISCFQKLRGDLYRYLLEFALPNEIPNLIKNAIESYEIALNTSLKDLKPSDPLRLGVVLNYAVFKYEHLKEIENAKEMVQNAIQEFKNFSNDLTPNSQKESKNVIDVMQSNLINWSESNFEEETEEESN